ESNMIFLMFLGFKFYFLCSLTGSKQNTTIQTFLNACGSNIIIGIIPNAAYSINKENRVFTLHVCLALVIYSYISADSYVCFSICVHA
ncbi:hypothetical protein ACJX0J_008011, partial [Zea mays]